MIGQGERGGSIVRLLLFTLTPEAHEGRYDQFFASEVEPVNSEFGCISVGQLRANSKTVGIFSLWNDENDLLRMQESDRYGRVRDRLTGMTEDGHLTDLLFRRIARSAAVVAEAAPAE